MNMTMDYVLALVAGVLGSMHCVGMCGAVVLAYSTQPEAARSSVFSSIPLHLAYNGGRVLSYTLIGALAGLLGGMLRSVQEVAVWFSITSGALMIVTGLLLLGLIPQFDLPGEGKENWFRRLHLRSVASLLSLRTSESKFYIGLLTPLLPCGLLYSMLLKAGSTGSPLEGGLTMLLFASGIVPALLLTGLVSAYVGRSLRTHANRLAAVTIILMGITLILRGAGFPFLHGSHGHH